MEERAKVNQILEELLRERPDLSVEVLHCREQPFRPQAEAKLLGFPRQIPQPAQHPDDPWPAVAELEAYLESLRSRWPQAQSC